MATTKKTTKKKPKATKEAPKPKNEAWFGCGWRGW